MKKLVLKSSLVAFLLLFFSVEVYAQQSEIEKRYLITMTTEIENLKSLAQKAESTADKGERLQFDYAALQRDLDEMQRAIEQHVKAPSRSPRKIDSLTTHYTRPLPNGTLTEHRNE